jgi:restriction endonuclease Mrr
MDIMVEGPFIDHNKRRFFILWDNRLKLDFNEGDRKRKIQDLFADNYPRDFTKTLNLADVQYLSSVERRKEITLNGRPYTVELPPFIIEYTITVRNQGILGLKENSKNVTLGATYREDLRELASECGVQIQASKQHIQSLTISVIKANVVRVLKQIRNYVSVFHLTESALPSWELTKHENEVFQQWFHEPKTIVERPDISEISEYIKFLESDIDSYQIDDIPLKRVAKIINCSNEFKVGAQEYIDYLSRRIKDNPHDAQAYYELALHMMHNSSVNLQAMLKYETKGHPESVFIIELNEQSGEIKELLKKSVALGLGDPIHSAIANFSYAFLLGSVQRMSELRDYSKARVIYQDTVNALEDYLRRDPHNWMALRILSASYKMLNQPSKVNEVDLLLEKVQVLQELGAQKKQSALRRAESNSAYEKGAQFESVCLELFQRMGFDAKATAISRDGGIDIVAFSSDAIVGGKYIVQCKAWKSSVGEPLVRDLYGLVHAENANKGIFITTSTYTTAAHNFARDKPLELINGKQLLSLIRKYMPEVLKTG